MKSLLVMSVLARNVLLCGCTEPKVPSCVRESIPPDHCSGFYEKGKNMSTGVHYVPKGF